MVAKKFLLSSTITKLYSLFTVAKFGFCSFMFKSIPDCISFMIFLMVYAIRLRHRFLLPT